MIKKILAVFLLILILTGCSSKNSDKEICFWTLQMGDFAPYINNIIEKYEKSHVGIKIKWVDVPFSEGEKRTLVAVMTDNPPDLINLNPDFSNILAQKGTLYEIPDSALEDFAPDIVKALKYNDKNYSIPWYATSALTIYNKELFEKSKLIRLPKTYDELAKVSKKIKENTGAYSYLPTITENDTMAKILNKYGVSEIAGIDSSESIKVFEMFKNLYLQDLIPPETITMTHREALEQYMAGKTVFYQGGANFLNMIKENAPAVYKNTDVAEQIKGPLGQNDFSVMNFIIPLKAKNKQEALDFCLFLTNEENQLELARLTNIISTNSRALSNKFYNDYSDLQAKSRSISARQIQKITPAFKQSENQKEINLQINSAVQSILLNKANTEDVLKKIAKIRY